MQTPARKLLRTVGVLTLLCAPLFAMAAPGPSGAQIFAAPAGFSTVSPTLSVVRTVLALALVLGLVFGAAALMRRLRLLSGVKAPNLEVLSQISLGARERAVLLRAGRQQLLVGVAPGNVRLLCLVPDAAADAPDMPAAPAVAPPGAAPPGSVPPGAAPLAANFRELLRRSLGR